MVRMEFTLRRFPISAALKDRAGLPFGCVFQPFARSIELPLDGAALEPATAIGRCGSCYAYVSCFCSFDALGWVCSLCGKRTDYTHTTGRRYHVRAEQRQQLPEVSREVFEALVEEPLEVAAGPGGTDAPVTGPAPIYVALVDTSGGDEFIELVRSALLAALEALPSAALFGIITFSNKIGLHDVKSLVPSVRYMPVFEGQAPLMALEDLMPLTALLAPVGAYKDALTAVLEALAPEYSFERSSNGAGSPPLARGVSVGGGGVTVLVQSPGQDSMQRTGDSAGCAFGPALQGVLEYLQPIQSPPFTVATGDASTSGAHDSPLRSPAKLMVFLSGVPDLGAGRLVDRPPPPPVAASGSGRRSSSGGPRTSHTSGGGGNGAPASAGGGPDAVPARISGLRLQDDGAWLKDVSPAARQFYEQAAVAAASLGVCVDLFAVSHTAVGLQVLQPLCNSTGGAVYLYPSLDDAALPQDVYRRLSTPQASAGVLRIRTSPGFIATGFYGRLFADPQHDNLHHIISCDAGDTFAADFEFRSAEGFSATDAVPPTVQIAFQYTVAALVRNAPVVARAGAPAQPPGGPSVSSSSSHTHGNGGAPPPQPGAEAPATPPAPRRLVVQRRLRVATFRMHTSRDVLELYQFANPAAVVSLLMHKIMRAARSEGQVEARMLLRDWLVILATNYHRSVLKGVRAEQLPDVPVDLTFGDSEALQPLPRLVYALLRSPLLALPAEGQHPDLTTFLEHLWACLPPQELVTAIYPVLSSYTNPDTQALSRHSLSRTALLSGAPLFLLDAYIIIFVLYAASAAADLPYPPPQQSALRRAIGAIRHERRITPQVRVVREGSPEAELFMQLLLDEPEGHAGPEGQQTPQQQQFGLVNFMEHIRAEVVSQLQGDLAAAAGQQYGSGGGGTAARR